MHLRSSPTSRSADDPARVTSPIADTAVVLAYARMLHREQRNGSRHLWLRGKNIGSLGVADHGTEVALFRQAAAELGAKVTPIRPFPDGGLAASEVQVTARLIGRLYDAVDWPGAPPDVLQRVQSASGIPVYDGLAAAHHPSAHLAGLLPVDTPMEDRRRFVLQAVLLATII